MGLIALMQILNEMKVAKEAQQVTQKES